jgi:hypothetical protein
LPLPLHLTNVKVKRQHFCVVLGRSRFELSGHYGAIQPFLKHVRTAKKSVCYVRVLPPLSLSACISAVPTGRISVKFDFGGLLSKYVQKIHVWLQSGKNIGHFALRPKYSFLFQASLNLHKSALP